MNEYLTFRKMITPVLIQVIFWIALVAIVIAGLVALGDSVAGGILIIVLGPLAARVYAEFVLVVFRIYDDVSAIRRQGESVAPTPPPASM
jgi:hypothetical protein